MGILETLRRVRNDGLALKELPEFQNNLDVARAAVRNNGLALQYVGEELVKNICQITEIALAALGQTADAWQFVPEQLKKDLGFAAQAFITNEQIESLQDPIFTAYLETIPFWENIFTTSQENLWRVQLIPKKLLSGKNICALLLMMLPKHAKTCSFLWSENMEQFFQQLPEDIRNSPEILMTLMTNGSLPIDHSTLKQFQEGPVWETMLYRDPSLIKQKLESSPPEILQDLVLKAPLAIQHIPLDLKEFWTQDFLMNWIEHHPHCLDSIPPNAPHFDSLIETAVQKYPKNILHVPKEKLTEELICLGLTANSPIWEQLKTHWELTQKHAKIAMGAHGANWRFLPQEWQTEELALIGLRGNNPGWKINQGFVTRRTTLFSLLPTQLRYIPSIVRAAAERFPFPKGNIPNFLRNALYKTDDLKNYEDAIEFANKNGTTNEFQPNQFSLL